MSRRASGSSESPEATPAEGFPISLDNETIQAEVRNIEERVNLENRENRTSRVNLSSPDERILPTAKTEVLGNEERVVTSPQYVDPLAAGASLSGDPSWWEMNGLAECSRGMAGEIQEVVVRRLPLSRASPIQEPVGEGRRLFSHAYEEPQTGATPGLATLYPSDTASPSHAMLHQATAGVSQKVAMLSSFGSRGPSSTEGPTASPPPGHTFIPSPAVGSFVSRSPRVPLGEATVSKSKPLPPSVSLSSKRSSDGWQPSPMAIPMPVHPYLVDSSSASPDHAGPPRECGSGMMLSHSGAANTSNSSRSERLTPRSLGYPTSPRPPFDHRSRCDSPATSSSIPTTRPAHVIGVSPPVRQESSAASSTRSVSRDPHSSMLSRAQSRESIWVSLNDSDGPPYVPTHLENRRRTTPRRTSEFDEDDISGLPSHRSGSLPPPRAARLPLSGRSFSLVHIRPSASSPSGAHRATSVFTIRPASRSPLHGELFSIRTPPEMKLDVFKDNIDVDTKGLNFVLSSSSSSSLSFSEASELSCELEAMNPATSGMADGRKSPDPRFSSLSETAIITGEAKNEEHPAGEVKPAHASPTSATPSEEVKSGEIPHSPKPTAVLPTQESSSSAGASSSSGTVSVEVLREAVERAKRRRAAAN